MRTIVVTLLLAFGALVPAAQTAPPANDDRGSAQGLAVPSTVRGTTVDATTEPGEPFACTGAPANSVWYSIAAPAAARDLVVELDAAGDLDAVVDVFRRDRSQLASVACGQTDRRGRLTLDFPQPRNAPLLVRVAQRENSASATFSLRVVAPDDPERPPGRALGAAGASGSVDRIANPDAPAGRPARRSPSPSRSLPDERAGRGPRVSSRGPWRGRRVARRLRGMPHPTRSGLGEVAITTTLLSIYLSARSTNRALGAVQAAMSGFERTRRMRARGGR